MVTARSTGKKFHPYYLELTPFWCHSSRHEHPKGLPRTRIKPIHGGSAPAVPEKRGRLSMAVDGPGKPFRTLAARFAVIPLNLSLTQSPGLSWI